MKWTLIDNDGASRTHYMMVPGGTLYKVQRDSTGIALCFVPNVSYVPLGSAGGGSAGGYGHTFTSQLPPHGVQ